MQTILDILKKAGGWHPGLYLKIDNAPYMELVIEAMDESGPMGLPALSVAHYGEQNGDLMRDPEMCFELGLAGGAHLDPWYWRNDYVAVEQWSRNIARDHYVHLIASARAARPLRPDMGQQPALAAVPGSLRSEQVHTRIARVCRLRSGHRQRVRSTTFMQCNRSKGACHHGNPNRQCHRIPQRLALSAE